MSAAHVRPLGDPLDFVREHPELFLLPGALPLEFKMAFQLMFDATVRGAAPVILDRWHSWILIGSQKDWLTSETTKSDKELFAKVVAFPEAGQNACRHEIVVNVFASDVAVIRRSGITVIKGTTELSSLKEYVEANFANGTVVAFRVEGGQPAAL